MGPQSKPNSKSIILNLIVIFWCNFFPFTDLRNFKKLLESNLMFSQSHHKTFATLNCEDPCFFFSFRSDLPWKPNSPLNLWLIFSSSCNDLLLSGHLTVKDGQKMSCENNEPLEPWPNLQQEVVIAPLSDPSSSHVVTTTTTTSLWTWYLFPQK